jgi:hypothetical protein
MKDRGMGKLEEYFDVDRVINVDDMAGTTVTSDDGDVLFVLRIEGEDAETDEAASVALVYTADELATVCAQVARLMINKGQTEILLKTWHEALLGPRVN